MNSQVNANLLDLDEKGAIIIVDYKMKILPKSARETKSAFFGKKGWSLHSILVYTKNPEVINWIFRRMITGQLIHAKMHGLLHLHYMPLLNHLNSNQIGSLFFLIMDLIITMRI